MKRETSCGVLLFQERPLCAFLVLYRKDGSPDLPKGKKDKGETDEETALRELSEETGLVSSRVHLTPGFVYDSTYSTKVKKTGEPVMKTVRVFHAVVDGPVTVALEAHADYAWLPWPLDASGERIAQDNPTMLGALRAWSAAQASASSATTPTTTKASGA